MVGITQLGVYLPIWRLPFNAIKPGMKGEKAVAGPDEDSVTMAVEAANNCLKDVDRHRIGGVILVSTTFPYIEKQASTIVAAATDLQRNILTLDVANCLKSGVTALKLAWDMVKTNCFKKILVVTSDSRLGSPGSTLERVCGDGAVAFVVGEDEAIIELEGSYSISNEMFDFWRSKNDIFIRSWEDRFINTEGYFKTVAEGIAGVLKTCNLEPKDFAKIVLSGPDSRRILDLAKQVGFDPKSQVQAPLMDVIGNTGVSHPLILLASALESANPGDRLLLTSYGNGSETLVLRVTEHIDRIKDIRTTSENIKSKREVSDYLTYLHWKNLIVKEEPKEEFGRTEPSATAIWRERDAIYAFYGVKCKTCGTVQYPPQRICTKCHTQDNFDKIRLSDKKGKLFSYSKDAMFNACKGFVDYQGGGRIFSDLTDCDINELKIGIDVEPCFRKLMSVSGMHHYFWKARPRRY